MLNKTKLKYAIDITNLTQVFTPKGIQLPWNEKTLEDNDDLAISKNAYISAQNTKSWHDYVNAIEVEIDEFTESVEEVEVPIEELINSIPVNVLPDFDAMTKKEIDVWAGQELGLSIDGRATKASMIDTIINELK